MERREAILPIIGNVVTLIAFFIEGHKLTNIVENRLSRVGAP